MNEEQRREAIVKHLTVAKPYSEQISGLIDEIRSLTFDITNNPGIDSITKAKLFAELASYFSNLAARELS